jgi:uncharacterized membrane protein YhaH (DUF805 family)
MGFVQAVKAFYRNFVKFDGRALRSEYWWPQLFFILLYVVMFAGAGLLGQTIGGILALVISLIILISLIPAISVTIRRLHDVDKSGWFFLLAFVPLVNFYILYLTIIKGTDGPNRFGPDPLGSDASVFS